MVIDQYARGLFLNGAVAMFFLDQKASEIRAGFAHSQIDLTVTYKRNKAKFPMFFDNCAIHDRDTAAGDIRRAK